MSNQAIKIIYNALNLRDNIACERVFAVEADFEKLLISKKIPLYTLESGIPLKQLDMLGFSIGYELGMTSVLSMLNLGHIPLLSKDRDENHPIVIAGGCGVTNPAPLAPFFDAFFIGEAEDEMFDLIEKLSKLKEQGYSRSELLKEFSSHPSVWIKGKSAVRAINKDFGRIKSVSSYNPLPSIKPVQDHGVVEIMRGCPNGCRFCHAGIYYRPQRMKDLDVILEEVDELVNVAGYKEISLTSLSSGDYNNIDSLLEILNAKYKSKKVSFQLPSLKVSSFTLPVLESISQTRKSGLTFAVETPVEAWQFSLNKEVYEEKLFDIIMNAKKRGWNKAKFYFMVGLPVGPHALGHAENIEEYEVGAEGTEERFIVDFMLYIQEKTKIQCNVNVGTFIPKPHTPYQWAAQISQDLAREKLFYIRNSLPKGKFRTSTHNQFVSFIEGLISRGDEKVGDVILSAYEKGCRLDAWDDHINKDLWREAIAEVEQKYNCNFEKELCVMRNSNDKLPWDDINLGTTKSYLKKEWERSLQEMRSPLCKPICNDHCGLCEGNLEGGTKVYQDIITNDKKAALLSDIQLSEDKDEVQNEQNIEVLWRAVFSFRKENGSEYLPHLALVENFHKAFMRSNLPIMYTNGFNPLPRFELASSLSLGVKSQGEIASVLLSSDVLEQDFQNSLQEKLPKNIHINNVFVYPISNKKKRESLASILWGSRYTYTFLQESSRVENFLEKSETVHSLINRYDSENNTLDVVLPFSLDRPFRDSIKTFFNEPLYRCIDITRTEMYAKKSMESSDSYYSYFEAYNKIAKIHKELIDN